MRLTGTQKPHVGSLLGPDPAHRLLLLDGERLTPLARPRCTCPDLGIQDADQRLAVRVHGHDGMDEEAGDEEAGALAIGAGSQPLAAAGAARES